MLFKKNNCRIVITAGVMPLLFLFGCNKLNSKDPIVFKITAMMPNTDTPVPGVRYRIVETKNEEETGWELTGITDAYGNASGSFKGVIKGNYSYFIYFDYSDMVVPAGLTDVWVDGPAYDRLSRNAPHDNEYEIRVLPYTSYHLKIENVNCFDENDKMRFKVFNYDDRPNRTFEDMPWGNYFEGCGLHVDYTNNHIVGGHHVYQIEVTRNGEVTTYVDTFNFLPNVMNEVFIEY